MTTDRPVNRALLAIDQTPHEGKILFANPPFLKLQDQVTKCLLMLCDDHHSRGILVQSMDNPGAPLSADPLETRAMMEKGIHQSATSSSCGRVDYHTCGLIHDDAVLVFIENIQRN